MSQALLYGRTRVRRTGLALVMLFHAVPVILFSVSKKPPPTSGEVKVLQIFSVRERPAPQILPSTPVPLIPRVRRLKASVRASPVLVAPPPVALWVPEIERAVIQVDPLAEAPVTLGQQSRALARKFDRDDRKGKLAPLGSPTTPFAKMRQAMQGAHVGGAASTSIYTSPDGVSITRISRGGVHRCFISAGVNGVPSAAMAGGMIGRSGGARTINCPADDALWRAQ